MSDRIASERTYQHGHHPSVVADHAKRTAEVSAAFFIPFLHQGMRVLDVGCGPGTITSGLARLVSPGEVIGIDPSPTVIETARSLGKGRETGQLQFEVGDIHRSRFGAESFDAVFAHQVLQHLAQPVEALKQIWSLLKQGGVVGARDVDWGSTMFYPDNDGMRRFLALYYDLAHHNGAEPNAGRHLRRWFREAGFHECGVTTSTVSYADAVATRAWGESYAERTLSSNIAERSLELGITTRTELEDIAAAWRDWGRDQDAYFCFVHTEVVAWKR